MRSIAAALALCLACGAAHAVGAGERQIAVEGGVQKALSLDDPTPYFGAVGRYGLSDAWSARLEAGTSIGRDAAAYWGGAGVGYSWDVVRWVPFVDAGVVTGGAPRGWFLGGAATLGIEYLLGPHWTVGAVGRWWFLPRNGHAVEGTLHLLTATMRVGYVF